MAKQNILTRLKKTKAAECYREGRLQEADALYKAVCQSDPGDVGALVMRAQLNRELGKIGEAENCCRRALVINPDFALAHQELGAILMSQGSLDQSVAAFLKAIQLQPDFPEVHYNFACVLREMSDFDKAEKHYRIAVRLRPNFVQALNNLGAILTMKGENSEAADFLNKANALMPGSPEILSNIGELLSQDDRHEEAIDKYRRALEIDPDHIAAIVALADILEHTNQFEDAKALVDRGLILGPHNPQLHVIAARLERRNGQYKDAAQRLETILSQTPDSPQLGPAYMLLGALYDRLNKPDLAFECFSRGNLMRSEFEKRISRKLPNYLDHVQRMHCYLKADFGIHALESFSEPDIPTPVFLMGFMRSGTTLLEQVLDNHPALQAIEEKPTVNTMVKAFEEIAQGRENALVDLTADEIVTLRRIYFDEVRQHYEIRPGAILVDKMPLSTAHAHIIWRVFPDAKFILAVRHPCDVCLSSFMQNFRINESTSNFLNLEEGVRTYAAVMNIWRAAEKVLPIQYHRIRYEDLVVDFEKEVRHLLDFLGLEWRDEVLGFAERALKRGNVQTASYHQVTQPIYQHAKYRWKHYAEQLAPVMGMLQPFIEYFGYAESDGHK